MQFSTFFKLNQYQLFPVISMHVGKQCSSPLNVKVESAFHDDFATGIGVWKFHGTYRSKPGQSGPHMWQFYNEVRNMDGSYLEGAMGGVNVLICKHRLNLPGHITHCTESPVPFIHVIQNCADIVIVTVKVEQKF